MFQIFLFLLFLSIDLILCYNLNNNKFYYKENNFHISKVIRKNYFYWLAHHKLTSNINGASWYKLTWENNSFDSLDLYDHLIDIIPCQNNNTNNQNNNQNNNQKNNKNEIEEKNSWVIQVGSHLSIFILQLVERGCKGISIEGNDDHIPLINLSIDLNNQNDRHYVINGVGDDHNGITYFNMDTIDHSKQLNKDSIPVQSYKLDSIIEKYLLPNDVINVLIIDVEGSETNVLNGAKDLILSGRVQFFNVEVWFRKYGNDILTHSGLELLVNAGYSLFFGRAHSIRMKIKYHFPKPIQLKNISPKFIQRICGDQPFCLRDIYAFNPSKYSVESLYNW